MAIEIKKDDFFLKLTEAVEDAGQDLIDRAADIVGGSDLLSSMTITIRFDPEYNMRLPRIEVYKEYLCKNALDRFRGDDM